MTDCSDPLDDVVDELQKRRYSVWQNLWAIAKTLYYLSPIGSWLHPTTHELYVLSYKYVDEKFKKKE